jgi:glutamine---fructose-6-phosphate transaminase (isomerizing)
MCGIIGYVGSRKCQPILLHGLERLEYRGYDSAGLALVENGKLAEIRAVGNLRKLEDAAASSSSRATTGVGHTRWATHGRVCAENAHPLTGCIDGDIDLVLNGIVENYRELKASLLEEGHEFSSETDAEVIAHLVERHYEGDLVAAVRAAYAELEGHFAFVVLHREHPELLVGARHQCPLLVGVGEGEMFLASMAAAFLRDTRRIQLIDDDEIVAVTPQGATFWTVSGETVERAVEEVDWDIEAAEKSGFETFMLKEIYEQPDAVEETIGDRIRQGRLELEGLGLDDEEIRNLRRIVIVACGTAYPSSTTSRASGGTGIRCCHGTRSSSASRSPARRRTRWRR